MNIAQLLGFIRHLGGFIGAYGVSVGLGSNVEWEAIVGGVIAAAAMVWSYWEKRGAP